VRELRADPAFPIRSVRFSHDGAHVAAGGESGVAVWEVASGRLVRQARCDGSVVAVEFVPKANALWAGGSWSRIDGISKGGGGTVVRWDWGRERAEMLAHQMWNTVDDVRLTPGGKHLLAAAGNHVYLLDATTGARVHAVEVKPYCVHGLALAADGRRVVAVSPTRTISVIDYQTGRLAQEWNLPPDEQAPPRPQNPWAGVTGVAAAPDGKGYATSVAGSTKGGGGVLFWDTEGKVIQSWQPFTATTTHVTYDPSGRFLICGGWDAARNSGSPPRPPYRAVTVWTVKSGRLVTFMEMEHLDHVTDLAVSEPAGMFAVSQWGVVRLYRFPQPAWGDLP